MPGSPKHREVNGHLASADEAAESMKDATNFIELDQRRTKALVGVASAVSIAVLDLADAIRAVTDAPTTVPDGIQDMRRDRSGG